MGSSSVKCVSAVVNTGKVLAQCEAWPKTNADRRLQRCRSYLLVTKTSNTTQPRLAGPQWQLAWLHPPGEGPATRGCLLLFKVRAGYRDTPRLRMDAPVWAAGWLQTKVQFPQCHLRGPQQVQTRSPRTLPGMGPHPPPTTYHGRQPQPRTVRPHSRRHSLKS